jgi:hypothetical protein
LKFLVPERRVLKPEQLVGEVILRSPRPGLDLLGQEAFTGPHQVGHGGDPSHETRHGGISRGPLQLQDGL